MQSEFDNFADNYYQQHAQNITVTGEAPEYFAEYKIADARRLIDASGTSVTQLLDFGAGTGNSILYFSQIFPRQHALLRRSLRTLR